MKPDKKRENASSSSFADLDLDKLARGQQKRLMELANKTGSRVSIDESHDDVLEPEASETSSTAAHATRQSGSVKGQ